jgi:hypothetical protein
VLPLEIAFGDRILRRRSWLGSGVFARVRAFAGTMNKGTHEMVLEFIRRVIEMILVLDIKLLFVFLGLLGLFWLVLLFGHMLILA